MGLRCLLIAPAILLLAVQARADTADEVKDAVRTIQNAFNKGDVDTLRGLMTENLTTTLTYARFSSAADLLKVQSEWKFSEY